MVSFLYIQQAYLTEKNSVSQFLQEFLRTKDGRQLTGDEIRVKVLHFKRDIDADKVQIQHLQHNLPQDSIQLKQKLTLTAQKEFFFGRLQQLLSGQIRANMQQQQQPSMGDGGAGAR